MSKRATETLNRADVASAIKHELGTPLPRATDIVEQIVRLMSDSLAAGKNVKITNFGSFILRDKGLRTGRNPRTGDEFPIDPRRIVTFRATEGLRRKIEAGGRGGEESE